MVSGERGLTSDLRRCTSKSASAGRRNHGYQTIGVGAVAPNARRFVHRDGVAGPDHRRADAGPHPGGARELRAWRPHRMAYPSARPDPPYRIGTWPRAELGWSDPRNP